MKNSSSQSRTCIYVNKCLRLDQWTVKTVESNICSIRILTRNTDDKMQMLRLLNVYNLNSLFIIFTKKLSTISRLNKLLKNNCKQLVVEDFNLHHLYWEERRCFTQHMMTDTLLNIITNARLKLLLKLNTITHKTHNQFTMINLVFSSEKIQSMTCKCEVWINLHQKSDHLSIVTELNLQTISVQLSTRRLWKKWTQKHWVLICKYIFCQIILWTAKLRWMTEQQRSSEYYKRLLRSLLSEQNH